MKRETLSVPTIHLPPDKIQPSMIPIREKNLGRGYSRLSELRDSSLELIATLTGCFDLNLHGGHQLHLQQARSYAPNGFLVVGVNSDSSVKQLKGPDRPIDCEEVRLRRIIETPWVDYAYIFDDVNAIPTLAALKPDVYVTFYEKLYGKVEIEYIAENMHDTVLRINIDYAKNYKGERISTSSILASQKR